MPTRFCLLPLLLLPVSGCEAEEEPSVAALTAEQLLVPQVCGDCHPEHLSDWKASMHAQASDDPVFRAMNARAVEAGAGDFCARCHAPMAVVLERTDGSDLEALPQALRGVTCAFCHQVAEVDGDYNNPLVIELDGVMRGGIHAPQETGAHASAYSALHDRRHADSSRMCGSCHDVVNGHGLALERTLAEWRDSIYNSPDPLTRTSCSDCHMRSKIAPIATDGPERRLHGHLMAGVDVHLNEHPDAERQKAAVQRELDTAVGLSICVRGGGASGTEIFVELSNLGVGHAIPSGAGHYRRMWVELEVEDASGERLLSRGLEEPEAFVMKEVLLDAEGAPTEAPWAAVEHTTTLLMPPVPTADGHRDFPQRRRYGVAEAVGRVQVAVKFRPMPLELLESLAASGEIAPEVPGRAATFTMVELDWTEATSVEGLLLPEQVEVRCVSR